MTKMNRTARMKTPPESSIPREAKEEILSALARDMRISAAAVDAILYKYGVCRDPAALQRSYRLAAGQRLMARIRDDAGKREVLAVPSEDGGMEYIVVDGCNDVRKLKAIRHRLHRNIAGLENTSGKVKARQGFLCRLQKRLSGRR